MKKSLGKIARYAFISLLLISFSATLISCVVHSPSKNRHHSSKMPPGQHKKVHGDRSAKRYAPGQQKKQYKKQNKKHHNERKLQKQRR